MKRLVPLLFLLASSAYGMDYRTTNHSWGNISASGTVYSSVSGASSWATQEARVFCIAPENLTITSVDFWAVAPGGAGKKREIQVRVDQVDKLGCDIEDTETHCSATGSIPVTAEQVMSVKFVPTNTPAASVARWSVGISTAGEHASFMCGTTKGAMLTASGGLYILNGIDDTTGTAAFISEFLVSTPGVVDNLYVRLSVAPGAGKSRTFEVKKNGAADGTGVSCQIADTDKTCSDTANSGSILAGEDIVLAETVSGAVAGTRGNFAIRYTADRAGTLMIGDSIPDNVDLSNNRYWWWSGHQGTYDSSEDHQSWQSNQPIMECYRVHFEASGPPGGFGGAYAMTIRENGADSDLTCTMSDPATTCSDDGLIVVTDGDNKFTKEVDPIGPGNTPTIHGTLTCEVPSRRRW
jgi:hypothetical protein